MTSIPLFFPFDKVLSFTLQAIFEGILEGSGLAIFGFFVFPRLNGIESILLMNGVSIGSIVCILFTSGRWTSKRSSVFLDSLTHSKLW